MYFKFSLRKHPDSGRLSGYYRLVESYRNADNRVCHRTILNIGFMEDAAPEQLNKIQKHLTEKYEHKASFFDLEEDPIVRRYVEDFWSRIVSSKKLDIKSEQQLSRMVDMDTIQHSNAREIGAENIAFQTWEKLQLTPLLLSAGFSAEDASLAATQVVSRAVYPASELKTVRWIKENSAVCELTGYDMDKITKDKLYKSALELYKVKDSLEKHLSKRTNELFDLQDKIILYDLTNTYFEGEKPNSKLAQYGRSKEKRKDAKLVVLALVVNVEGFIKYSSILEGNIADCNTLAAMIEKLSVHTCTGPAVVVLDAGIATEENLHLIQSKGYSYLCVSRTKLKDYSYVPDRLTTLLETKSKQNIRLRAVSTEKNTDYYLEVKSPSKEKKEEGMKLQFEQRFEQELQKIQHALNSKGGVKKTDKVHQRIGRAKEKYPSVQYYYEITVESDPKTEQATAMSWKKNPEREQAKADNLGIYFLRTNLNVQEEYIIWNIYNTIREIENAFRTLKTDLDLRPIYHKNDDATMAHLHLGILAYWIVNTVRYQLKQKGIKSCWGEIVRIGNTQKAITTSGKNTYDKVITTRKCTVPNKNLKEIYDILQTKYQPFTKRKSVVHKLELKKTEIPRLQLLTGG
ncbi:IS1634 family transposase [Cecembia calidifontis]|uniref:Transposase n=1 Tax=Cecembia calidifontis TaxID=1187080 RepID=A0A4Q7P8G0_9BACT|nr:IS1634 family transposase [Cecembia calidifontis]RZS95836.1 transposase [Cecembia calidifontis]RZS96463.1 transposase [Cecembia calidifontis]